MFTKPLQRFGTTGLISIAALLCLCLSLSAARVPNATLQMPAEFPIVGYGLTNAFDDLTFDQPVAIASVPGETNRIFIVEKAGRIFVITNLAQPTKTEFLDMRPETISNTEGGMLGLAFHPGFATNGHFYVFATVGATLNGTHYGYHDELARYSVDLENPDRALPASKLRLFAQFDNSDQHNAGDVKFGPDGYLYVSIGFEGPSSAEGIVPSQSIDSHFFGSVLRIDVDKRPDNLPPNPYPGGTTNYLVPSDNPFVGATNFNGIPVAPENVRTELYAVGLRNPWRISFDGWQLYCADVGGALYEEINLIERGGNYGWPYLEGHNSTISPAPPTLSPLHTYFHGAGLFEGLCVIGGAVYRGGNIPQLVGAYVFGDAMNGRIWALRHNGSSVTNLETITSMPHLAGTVSITTFGTDPSNGDVLVADYGGRIHRLIHVDPESVVAPVTLAETGAFADLAALTPEAGIVPYEVSVPFWSDGAFKQRWFSVPDAAATIGFDATKHWSFPTGTVWIKHFELELTNGVASSRRRIETRFLVKNSNGVYGVTYRWGDSVTNAVLVEDGGRNESFLINDNGTLRAQTWTYPSRNDCLKCHNAGAGFILGFNTPQLNCSVSTSGGSVNQIAHLNALGYLRDYAANTEELPMLATAASAAPIQDRVRSYLHANCSACHHAAGPLTNFWQAPITGRWADARIVDGFSFTAPADYRILKPGEPDRSTILFRTSSPHGRMPPLASTEFDSNAMALLREYVLGLPQLPWRNYDVGQSGREGSASILDGIMRVSGSGTNIGGSADEFHFLYRTIEGNGHFVARLTSAESNAVVGIMFRHSLTNHAPFAMLSLEGDQSARWIHRATPDSEATDITLALSTAHRWLRLVREGNVLRAFTSADGDEWSLAGEATVELGSIALAGLAVTSSNHWRMASAAFEEVSTLSVRLAVARPSPIPVAEPVELTAEVSTSGGGVRRVEFYDGAAQIAKALAPPYRVTWTNALAGDRWLAAKVITESGDAVWSEPVSVHRLLPRTRLAHVTIDTRTRGNWKGVYGSEGFLIVGDRTNLPPHVSLSASLDSVAVHAKRSTQKHALKRSRKSGRTAAFFTSPESFTVDVALLDGELHRLALYFVDWDEPFERVQRVEFLDPTSGELLHSQTISNFSAGIYLTQTVRGAIRICITRLGGPDAVLSGVFVDPAPSDFPEVQITAPSPGQPFTVPSPVSIMIQATDADGIEQVELFANGSKVGERATAPYAISWTVTSPGDHTLKARATDILGTIRDSTAVTIAAVLPAAMAELMRVDVETQGNWIGKYGADGFAIAGHATNYPPYAAATIGSPHAEVFWIESAPRELQTVDATSRVQNDWAITGPTHVWFNDGGVHLFAIYFLDPQRARTQAFSLRDGDTQEILFATNLLSFGEGVYFVFRARGHLQLEVNPLSGPPPVFSAFFFDPVPPTLNDDDLQLASSIRLVDGQLNFSVLKSKSLVGTFTIEWSEDLVTWTEAGADIAEVDVRDWGTFLELTYQANASAMANPMRFIRLRLD